jgi:hypothetical protein
MLAEHIEGQTPAEVADLISDVIKDKVVCDIGCGGGSFMDAMSRYAKKVFGIERHEDVAEYASERGFDVFHLDSFWHELPKADVYYSWSKDSMGVYLKAKHEGTKGIFILGYSKRPATEKFLNSLNAEVRTLKDSDWKVYITEL